MFNECVAKLVEERANWSTVEVLRLHASLLNFATKAYNAKIDYVRHCIASCASLLAKRRDEVRLMLNHITHDNGRDASRLALSAPVLFGKPTP